MRLSRLLVSTLFIFPLLITPVSANMSCQTDSYGNKICKLGDGSTWFGRKESSGDFIWTDNQGTIIREEKDTFGNTTYRDSRGVLRGRKDSFGNEEWLDKDGNAIKGRTDSFGKTNYRDSHSGKLIRCYENSLGTETCK